MGQEIALFPLNMVLFPGMILPLRIFEDRYKTMLRECMANSEPFGVVLLRSGRAEGPLRGEMYTIGTTAQITQVNALGDGTFNILTMGSKRFRIVETSQAQPYLSGVVEDFPLQDSESPAAKRAANRLLSLLEQYLETFRSTGKLPFRIDQVPSDPATLAFLTAIILPIENDEKQTLLEIEDTTEMLTTEYELLQHEVQIMRVLTNEPTLPEEESPFSLN